MNFEKYERCPICSEYGWQGSHRCKKFWFVRREEYDREDEEKAFGDDPVEAAEHYLERRFSDFDYPDSLTVFVVNMDETEEHKVDIEVEAVPSFSASIIETKPIVEEPAEAGGEPCNKA